MPIMCKWIFFGPDGKCKQASPLCKTFDTNNGYCLTCYNGYVISNNGNCAINQNQDTNCKNSMDKINVWVVIKVTYQ